MSAPMTKGQMAFELPKLSYIDTRWEEPVVQAVPLPVREHRFAAWMASRIAAFRAWRENDRARAELNSMSDHELLDLGLNRGDFDRIFDQRFNQDLMARSRAF
jgi:uncharacterized protein YjiS (DUF1127 family)